MDLADLWGYNLSTMSPETAAISDKKSGEVDANNSPYHHGTDDHGENT
jgi:hypothetical protein